MLITRLTPPLSLAQRGAPPIAPEQGSGDLLELGSSALCLGGGTLSLVGALGSRPLVQAGGLLALAVGSAVQAARRQKGEPLTGRAALALGLGTTLAVAGGLATLAGPPPSASHLTPFARLLQQTFPGL